jgi:hypothetical protein
VGSNYAPSERTMDRKHVKLGSRGAVLDELASSQPQQRLQATQCRWLRASEEGSAFTARSAPSELGERGNQA